MNTTTKSEAAGTAIPAASEPTLTKKIGDFIMPQPTDQLSDCARGHWLGRRGIFRHDHPTTAEALRWSKASGEPISHVMSTAVSGEFSGDVVGELIRWVDGHDGSVTFEARIEGTQDSAGITDIAAYSYEDIWAIAKVSNDIRYEWAAILENRREVDQ